MGPPMLLRQEVTAFIHRKHCQSHSQACPLTKTEKAVIEREMTQRSLIQIPMC